MRRDALTMDADQRLVSSATWCLDCFLLSSALCLSPLRSTSNPTPNFQVKADNEQGLLFKNKRDRKVINVDPNAECGDNSTRHVIKTKEYIQVVIYDHMTRRKS
jgi:hypothetical protein